MESIGYRYRGENGIRRRHYFVKGKPRTHHVHIVERNSDNWRQTVHFRDLLRSDRDAANEYALAKRALAERYARDRKAYQREKGRVIGRILAGTVEGSPIRSLDTRGEASTRGQPATTS